MQPTGTAMGASQINPPRLHKGLTSQAHVHQAKILMKYEIIKSNTMWFHKVGLWYLDRFSNAGTIISLPETAELMTEDHVLQELTPTILSLYL